MSTQESAFRLDKVLKRPRYKLVWSAEPDESVVGITTFQGRCLLATSHRLYEFVNDYPGWIIKVLEFVRLR